MIMEKSVTGKILWRLNGNGRVLNEINQSQENISGQRNRGVKDKNNNNKNDRSNFVC